jgi:moderate conductance mechanosensitive channel
MMFQSETTNPGESAVRGVDRVWDALYGFYEVVLDYVFHPEFIANLVATVLTLALGVLFYRVVVRVVPRLLYWRRPAGEARLDAQTRARMKRQDTAVTLIRNVLKYATFIIVALVIFSTFLRNALPAVAGASVLAAILIFGAQSFLRDIVAGFSILFENQYSVGDFIQVQPMNAFGVVEEFGLRTTKLRTLSGELVYIPNGVMMSVTNYADGRQWYTIEVQLKDAAAADRVAEVLETSDELFVTPPQLTRREEFAGNGVRLMILSSVLPSMDWLPREKLVQRIRAAAGEESLAAEPLVYTVNRRTVERLRGLIPPE